MCIKDVTGGVNGADDNAEGSTREAAAGGVVTAGVLIACALCPSLHLTKNLPA